MQTRIANFVLAILCMSYATQAQTVLLSEDFEGGTLGAFSAGVPVGTLNWNNTQIRGGDPGHSATRSAYFGNPADTIYDTGLIEGGDITSGALDLTGYNSATLTFNYYLETEAYTGYDIAQSLVSTDGFIFVAVASNQGSNLVDPSVTWLSLSVDLSAYAGFPTVYIRFDFNTVDDAYNAFEGFYVDDVVVTATTVACNLSVTTTSTDETISGVNDGTGTAVVTNGTTPYFYLWDDPSAQTTFTATGLAPGVYIVTVTDADSCVAFGTVIIQAGGVGCNLTVTTTSTDETFPGGNDGTGTAVVTGGTAPFFYLWDDPSSQTAAVATGLAPGTYTVTVIDADSCVVTDTVLIQAAGGCNLTVTATSTDESSAGMNDGTGTAFASNGTPPYNYLWSDGQTTAMASSLAPGTYTVTVTDANGCTFTATAVVNAFGCTMSTTVTTTDESSAGASDGTAQVTVTGGDAPYTYLWNDALAQTDSKAIGLAPGNYEVLVTDTNGCGSVSQATIQASTGLREVAVDNWLNIYPNPAAGFINFEISGSDMAMLHVFDFAGRQVKEIAINQLLTEINTAYLNNGMYFYQLIGMNSDHLGSGKFVIQK
jgi:hypothetical protein